jgi:hypothetical protein
VIGLADIHCCYSNEVEILGLICELQNDAFGGSFEHFHSYYCGDDWGGVVLWDDGLS